MIPTTTGLLDAGPTIANLIGSSSNDSSSNDSETTTSSDEEEDYRGQNALEDLYTPTLNDPDIDESSDSYQGEDSWQDFNEDDTDGAGSRYDRDTPWTTDAALQFDADVVDRLTVPDLQFTEEQREAFSDPGQTLDNIASDVRESISDGVDATPSATAADDFDQRDPGINLQSNGGNGWIFGVAGAFVVGVLAVLIDNRESQND